MTKMPRGGGGGGGGGGTCAVERKDSGTARGDPKTYRKDGSQDQSSGTPGFLMKGGMKACGCNMFKIKLRTMGTRTGVLGQTFVAVKKQQCDTA